MSDTPRTDANVGRVNNHFVFYIDTEEGELVKADFARQLERELAEMREQRDKIVLRLGKTQERMIDAERKLEELKKQ